MVKLFLVGKEKSKVLSGKEDYPRAIKKFLMEYIDLMRSNESHPYDPSEVEVSGSAFDDVISITQEGCFQVHNIKMTPGCKGGNDFCCHVGRTEFILTGQAAERIEEILKNCV